MKLYQIDAFADELFRGNPCAVIPLEKWLSDELMQRIAEENNLSETAFFVRNNDRYKIRWFTPVAEVNLCGHATLASAWVIRHELGDLSEVITLDSASGELRVRMDGEKITLDFPAQEALPTSVPELLLEGLGVMPVEVKANDDYLVVLQDQGFVEDIEPDFSKLVKLSRRGVIITAEAEDPSVDFVSRAFFPKLGVNEDPVTGSAHTKLVPYWAARLKKQSLVADQLSKRGGRLWCELQSDRVFIGGTAVKYLEGEIYL